jgi:hypothetical protein
VPLAEPSKELAARVLSRVGVEQRLVGVTMTPMAGVQQYPIHGFAEAINFLRIGGAAEALASGPRASIPYVDPKVLRRWVEEVFGDTDLAHAIEELINNGDSYADTIVRIRELMERRLSQSEAALRDENST